MLRRNGPVIKSVESVLRPGGSLWWERFVKEVDLEPEVKEGWMARVLNLQAIDHKQASQRQRDWNKVDGENYEVDSKDKVRHTKRNDQLHVTRMMMVVELG